MQPVKLHVTWISIQIHVLISQSFPPGSPDILYSQGRDEHEAAKSSKQSCDPFSYLAGAVQVFLVLGEFVKGQEGVAVASCAVADPVAFPQQTPLPDHLSTFCSFL